MQSNVLPLHHPMRTHILDQVSSAAMLLQAQTEQRFYALSLSLLQKHQMHLRSAHNSLKTAVKMGLVIPAVNTAMIGVNVIISSTLSGIINSLTLVTDSLTGFTSLSVNLTDTSNVVQVVSLDLSDTLALGLITVTVDSTKIGTSIVIDSVAILNSTSDTRTVTKLGNYFGPALGLTYDQLAGFFAAGYGYGVITQADG